MKPRQRGKKKNLSGSVSLDAVLKSVGAIVAVAGILFGIYQYYHRGDQERVLALRNRQLELYFKATDISSKFAQASTQQEAEQTRKQFWEIYNGELSIVEDESVKQEMMKFGGAVKAWEHINAPPSDFFPPSEFVYFQDGPDKAGITFEQMAYQLTQVCKDSLHQ